jgi:hypothetical protein
MSTLPISVMLPCPDELPKVAGQVHRVVAMDTEESVGRELLDESAQAARIRQTAVGLTT